MEASLDLSRWRELPRGISYRRWTIVSTGLRDIFRLRFFKILIALAWGGGIALAALGFLFSQCVAEGGWFETLSVYAGPRFQATYKVLAGFVLLYPDICIGGWYTLIFWLHSYLGLALSLVALTVMVPRLITRDRATNALLVYLSRPLTSTDYLLGKLGMIVGVLAAVWTGPLLFGWLLSIALSPNLDFILHSFPPLGRALLFHGIALATLASVALAASALGRRSRNTIILWIGLWLVLGVSALLPFTPAWLQRASFTYNLGVARQGILRFDSALLTAGESLPMINQSFAKDLQRWGNYWATDDFQPALISLGVFVLLSSFIFLRRLRPE